MVEVLESVKRLKRAAGDQTVTARVIRVGTVHGATTTVLIPAQWSGDGKSLIYTVSRGGATNLWRQALAGGPAEQVTKFSDETIFRYAMSHDQKRWAIVRGNTSSDVVLASERR